LDEAEGLPLLMQVVSVSMAAAVWFVTEGIIFTLPVTNISMQEQDVNLYEYHHEERSIYTFILRLLRVDSRTLNRVLCKIEHSGIGEGLPNFSEEYLCHQLRMS
jgi:hypothetical protein